jgi:GxxExxY protein
VYQAAFAIALADAGVNAVREPPLEIFFRGRPVGFCRPDFVAESVVVVGLKAARAIDASHAAQLLNYLRGTGLDTGLLFNFGPKPAFRRMVL